MAVFVKICGITVLEDGLAAARAGADAIGFIFYPPSKRHIDPAEAASISAELAGRVMRVGVFVNVELDELAGVAREVGLDFVQLHGDESPDYCKQAAELTGCGVIKALRVSDRASMEAQVAKWREAFSSGVCKVDYFLLDTYRPGVPGGTGDPFGWGLARGLGLPAPVILAGGLHPENVADALEEAGPAGVDVSSGVELLGGGDGAEQVGGHQVRKDHVKMTRFVEAVRRWEHGRRLQMA